MDICCGVLSKQTDQNKNKTKQTNKQTNKTKTKTKALRIKALQPPNQNIVNVKEVLEQSVIRFSQVQIRYIYILFCVLTAIVEASIAMRCYQTMRLSLSLSLSLHFLHFCRSSLLYCHGEGFGCCRRWIGCATHSTTYFFCKLPWTVFT